MKKEELIFEVNYQLKEVGNVLDELSSLIQELNDNLPNSWQKTALSSYCMQYYNGVENIMKRILKFYDIPLPKSESWHIELFDIFCNSIKENPIILFSEDIKPYYLSLLRLRHFVLHNYSTSIDWSRLKIACVEMPLLFNKFKINVNNFINAV